VKDAECQAQRWQEAGRFYVRDVTGRMKMNGLMARRNQMSDPLFDSLVVECEHGNPRGENYCANCRFAKGEKPGYALTTGRKSIDRNVVSVSKNARDTSLNAMGKAFPKSGTKRREIYELIKSEGMFGLCDHEIEQRTGWLHQSASASRNSLMKDGWIVDSGQRRKTNQGNDAIVWIISEKGETK
jgi:hypothetical protein